MFCLEFPFASTIQKRFSWGSLGLDSLEESLQVSCLIVEELDLISSFLLLTITSLVISLRDGFDFALELDHFVGLLLLLGFKLLDFLLEICLSMLSLQLFAHGESHRTEIQIG